MPTFHARVEPGQTWVSKDTCASTVVVVSVGTDFLRVRSTATPLKQAQVHRVRRNKFVSAYSRVS